MAKPDKAQTMNLLQSAARLSRTSLASRLNGHGLYPGQDQIMLALAGEDGQTPGQLALRLGVRPPTITKTINRLQSQGFLAKQASEQDGRQAHVFLTEGGRDAIKAIEKSVRKTQNPFAPASPCSSRRRCASAFPPASSATHWPR